MAEKYQDQYCPCGATVTAAQLRKGARQFYEFIVIGYLDRVVRRTLCPRCEVNLENVMHGKPQYLPKQ